MSNSSHTPITITAAPQTPANTATPPTPPTPPTPANTDPPQRGKTLFVDISGSVDSFFAYWIRVKEWYEANKATIRKICVWDLIIQEVSKTELEHFIAKRIGRDGTSSSVIAQYIVANKLAETDTEIVIFTDGEVSQVEVEKTDRILSGTILKFVTCFVISNGVPNLSVTCPFTRRNTSTVYYKNAKDSTFRQYSTSVANYKLLERLDPEQMDLATFRKEYQAIESSLIAENMGTTGDPHTRDLLLKLQKRLIQQVSTLDMSANYGATIREHLEAGNFDQALECAKTMTTAYFESGADVGTEIVKMVAHLVSLCGDLRGQFDLNRMSRADSAKIETAPDVNIPPGKLVQKPVVCPVMMDDEDKGVPQVLVVEEDEHNPKTIFERVDKSIADDIANCPFNVLKYPKVVDMIRRATGPFISTAVNKHMELTYCPFTRRKIIGTIPLGNCSQHRECGDYTIARLFSGGKIMGNPNLYWAVIWYLINTGKIEWLNDIKDHATEHLKYRLTNSITNASMCGLPQYVLTKVPTDVAIWYCINSCLLDQPTNSDTTRRHLFSHEAMVDIMEQVFKYPISAQALAQITRLMVLMSMLSLVKKDSNEFFNRIKCLKQNALHINTSNLSDQVKQLEMVVEWVPIDGSASPSQVEQILSTFPAFYRELSLDEIIGLASFVDPSKSASDIVLPITWSAPSTSHAINWAYGLKEADQFKDETVICPATFRPCCLVPKPDGTTVSWSTPAANIYGPLDEQMSCYHMFIKYFYKYNEFPNRDAYLIFCYNRSYAKNANMTLPYLIDEWYSDVLADYKPILQMIEDQQIPVCTIRLILKNSCQIEDRRRIESQYYAQMQTSA